MKILCVVEHGNAPSTRLRLRDCLDYYAALGVEATVIPTRRSSVTERLRVLREARRHDVVVLFKTIGFNEFELGLYNAPIGGSFSIWMTQSCFVIKSTGGHCAGKISRNFYGR